jgi:uncharacterized protein YbaR (Trm112 family)
LFTLTYDEKGFMISPDLLQMLCCPHSKLPLLEADDSLIQDLNEKIEAGHLKNAGDSLIKTKNEILLVTSDFSRAYPVINGIPVLLIDESILLK